MKLIEDISNYSWLKWAQNLTELLTIELDLKFIETNSSSPGFNKLQWTSFYIYIFQYLQGDIFRYCFNDFLVMFFNNKWPKISGKTYRLCSDHQWQSTMLYYKSCLHDKRKSMKRYEIDCHQFAIKLLDQKGIDFNPQFLANITQTGKKDQINSIPSNIPLVLPVPSKHLESLNLN